MSQSLLLDKVSGLIEVLPDPCPDFQLDESELLKLKSAGENSKTKPVKRTIRVKNIVPVNNTSIISSYPNQSSYPNGQGTTTSPIESNVNASPVSSSSSSSSSPSATRIDIFDESDIDSTNRNSVPSKKRTNQFEETKSSPVADIDPFDPMYSENATKQSQTNKKTKRETSVAHTADLQANKKTRRWTSCYSLMSDESFSKTLNTNTEHIKDMVNKFRILKRTTDTNLKQDSNDLSNLDNYLWAALGFFEAAALYEVRAINHSKTLNLEAQRQDIKSAIELYKGLVSAPLSEIPSLLTFYVSRCEHVGFSLRSIIGQRCLAMAHCRIWHLRQKSNHTAYLQTLKNQAKKLNDPNSTIDTSVAFMTDMNDIFKFHEYHTKSEEEAKRHDQVFSPFPEHPFDLDPFEFLEFIKQEHVAVEKAEDAEKMTRERKGQKASGNKQTNSNRKK